MWKDVEFPEIDYVDNVIGTNCYMSRAQLVASWKRRTHCREEGSAGRVCREVVEVAQVERFE